MTTDEQVREGIERCCSVRHQFLVERIKALEESTDDRFIAEEKAMKQRWSQLREQLTKVEEATIATKAQQNEWRSTMNDVLNTRLSKSEYDSRHQILADRLDALKTQHATDTAKLEQAGSFAKLQGIVFAALLSAVFAILVYLLFVHVR